MLQTLNLSGNSLSGTLPAAWGKDSAMGSLVTLDLAKNNFSGSIPAEWGTGHNNQSRFSQLAALIIGPGADMHAQIVQSDDAETAGGVLMQVQGDWQPNTAAGLG